jgi:hypothetical protein
MSPQHTGGAPTIGGATITTAATSKCFEVPLRESLVSRAATGLPQTECNAQTNPAAAEATSVMEVNTVPQTAEEAARHCDTKKSSDRVMVVGPLNGTIAIVCARLLSPVAVTTVGTYPIGEGSCVFLQDVKAEQVRLDGDALREVTCNASDPAQLFILNLRVLSPGETPLPPVACQLSVDHGIAPPQGAPKFSVPILSSRKDGSTIEACTSQPGYPQ